MRKAKRKPCSLSERLEAFRANDPDLVPWKPEVSRVLVEFGESLGLRVEYYRLDRVIKIYSRPSVNAILLETTQNQGGAASFLLGFQAAVNLVEFNLLQIKKAK